ncbi:hypothetical protein SDC9_189115 [bioreactor metagenome]|uniref:Metallo-beta-lactamase domain-containing protein n=1 Tax=bioreactor metagenome TaxID=1076179 RepID=A0A645HSW6_9ZZZZ
MVVIGGCAHSGFVNTVESGLKITGRNKLTGWIGGTHLGPASNQQQVKTIAQIDQYNPHFLMASHCTGFAMMAELHRQLGDRFIPSFVSQVINLD